MMFYLLQLKPGVLPVTALLGLCLIAPLNARALNAEFAKSDTIPNTTSQDCAANLDCDNCALIEWTHDAAYAYTETDEGEDTQPESTNDQKRRLEDRKTQDFDTSDSLDNDPSDSEFEEWRWRDYD